MGIKYEDGSSASGMWVHGLVGSGSGQGQVTGTCKGGNEPLGFIKCGEFLDQLRTD
jgi:hypothetical protein